MKQDFIGIYKVLATVLDYNNITIDGFKGKDVDNITLDLSKDKQLNIGIASCVFRGSSIRLTNS